MKTFVGLLTLTVAAYSPARKAGPCIDTKTKTKMPTLTNRFLAGEHGQDLIEYTLLMAFVALASAALFIGAGSSISGIWGATNTNLAAASTSAS
jgi:Flp pilus assembly pilin Flp